MEKILILTTFGNGGGGGAGKMASVLENQLFGKYKTVTLIAFHDDGIFPIKGKKLNIGVFGRKTFPGRGYLVLIPHIINTIKYIVKEKPDYVVGVGFYSNFLGLVAKKFIKFKLLLTQHEHISTQVKNINRTQVEGLILYMTKRILGKTKIVCVSKEVQKDIINYYGINKSQTQTIYNGLDFGQIKKLGNDEINIHEKFIINIGRLDTGKNQELLIKSYSKSRIKNNYKLLLLGEGYKEESLKELCKKLNIENNVIFAGFDKNPYKYLKKASLFCFTSITEAFGLVLLESLVLDIPIITVPVTGAKEILKDGKYGTIIDSWDEECLTNALDNFIENGGCKYNKEEKDKFLYDKFSVQAMSEQYIEVLKNL